MEQDRDLLLNGMDYANLLKLIKTKEEQNESIILIENLITGLYKKSLKSDILSPFSVILTDEIIKILQLQKIYDNKTKTEKFLNSLLASVKNLETLKISIAIEPNQKLVENVRLWADKNGLNNIIFDFTLDPSILGGAVIVGKKGTYTDFSLLKRINDVFLNQKQEILKLL